MFSCGIPPVFLYVYSEVHSEVVRCCTNVERSRFSTMKPPTTKHMLFVSHPLTFTAHSISSKAEYHLNIDVVGLIVVFLLSHVIPFLAHLPLPIFSSNDSRKFVFSCRILVFTSLFIFGVHCVSLAAATAHGNFWLVIDFLSFRMFSTASCEAIQSRLESGACSKIRYTSRTTRLPSTWTQFAR